MPEEGIQPAETATIEQRLTALNQRIERAARRAGRDPEEITLIGVSKRQSVQAVLAALRAGACELAESYVQEAREKIAAVDASLKPGEKRPRWHFIGGLQSNKAALAARLFDVVQTLDRPSLLERLERAAQEQGRRLPVLIEVNLSAQPGRSGVEAAGALALCERAAACEGVELLGLMGMAPLGGEQEARESFAALHALHQKLPQQCRQILSMGMSGDFEIAIEEGATHIRIGTALFGERPDG